MRILLAAACAALALAASTARADLRGVAALEVGVSLAEPTLVVGVEGGVRVDGQWTFLLEVDWNPWLTITGPSLATAGVLNVGVGVEHIYHQGTLRSALFLGSSTLLFESALDQAGSTGFFIELLPVSIRIPLLDDVCTLRVDPVSMHLIVPAFGVLPLVRYEFRHVVSVEITP
jgi:hypothetical protein